MKNPRKRKESNMLRETGKRLLAVFLCFVTLAGLLVPSAMAISWDGADGAEGGDPGAEPRPGTHPENTFILSVSTGAAAGNSVVYFGVRYIDGEGMERTEFVMPHGSSLSEGYQSADAVGKLYEQRFQNVIDSSGYYVDPPSEGTDGLRSAKTDMYLFRLFRGMKSVLGIDVFMKIREDEKNEWTANDISLYRVETLYGLDAAGYYSSDYFIDFDGELIAKFTTIQDSGHDFSLGRSDALFRLGRDNDQLRQIRTDFEEEEKQYLSSEVIKKLIFRMDIADYYGSGIEALSNDYKDKMAAIRDMGLCEALMVDFTYEDALQGRHNVKLPFITSFLAWATENNEAFLDASLIGIAQQGDTLVFEGFFPAFDHMTGFSVTYGAGAADAANIKPSSNNSPRYKTRIQALEDDPMNYIGFSVFDATEAKADILIEDAMVRCSTQGGPLCYYKTLDLIGQSISDGAKDNLSNDFRTIEKADRNAITLLPKAQEGIYVIEIVTDSMDAAATVDNIEVGLRYMSTDGFERACETINLRSAVKNYYGYWSGSTGDIAYQRGVSAGGKLIFSVNFEDVQYFTKVLITLDPSSQDDWQMKSFSIYEATSLSQRSAKWLPGDMEYGGNITDREITREYSSVGRTAYYNKRLLLNSEYNSEIISFSAQGGETEEYDVDWEHLKYSMTYNEARQDFGFLKPRYKYRVNVRVKSNMSANDTDGDCGSNNKFYFQLVFDNGNSGYVQANQQLTADGFRAGQTESFEIALNRNYGDLRAIRIIPDDTVDGEDIYDKMNISSIEIVMIGSGGVSRSWMVENVGWIGIDYQDAGAKTTASGQQLRSEAQLMQNYLINTRGYSLNLLFALSTGEYENGVQFQGALSAEVTYWTTEDQMQTQTFDVAKAIAEYARKDQRISYLPVGTNAGTKAMLDPSYMLRPNHVDRFVVSLPNVKKIVKVKFVTEGTVNTVWKLNNVDVYQIVSDGALFLNSYEEYQRDGEMTALCSSKNSGGYRIPVVWNSAAKTPTANEYEVEFGDNNISINTDSWEAAIERTPSGEDDSLNIYIYLDSARSSIAKLTEFNVAVQYQTRYDDTSHQVNLRYADAQHQQKTDNLKANPEKEMFYALGVGVRGLSALYQMSVKGSGHDYVDYAIVQHTRSGVVVNTYYIDYECMDSWGGLTEKPTPRSDAKYEQQKVLLMFSDGTDVPTLTSEKIDVAVMMTYTSTNDVQDVMYQSPYIYLTDQQVRSLHDGQLVELTFNENCVKEIRSVTIVGIGAVNASVEAITILTYGADGSGGSVLKAQYDVARSIYLTRAPQTVPTGTTPVTLLDFSFNSNPVMYTETIDDARISMEIHTVDSNDIPRTITVEDLSGYLISGGFGRGANAHLRMLLPDAREITYMKLEPHSAEDGGSETWYLDSMNVSICTGGVIREKSAAVNAAVEQGTGITLNLRDIALSAKVRVMDEMGEDVMTYTVKSSGSALELILNPGQSMVVMPQVTGSMPEYGVTVLTETDNPDPKDDRYTVVTDPETGYVTFTPGQVAERDVIYSMQIRSEEAAEVSAEILVKVPASAYMLDTSVCDQSGKTLVSGISSDVKGNFTVEMDSGNIVKIRVRLSDPSRVEDLQFTAQHIRGGNEDFVLSAVSGSGEMTFTPAAHTGGDAVYTIVVSYPGEPAAETTVTVKVHPAS